MMSFIIEMLSKAATWISILSFIGFLYCKSRWDDGDSKVSAFIGIAVCVVLFLGAGWYHVAYWLDGGDTCLKPHVACLDKCALYSSDADIKTCVSYCNTSYQYCLRTR